MLDPERRCFVDLERQRVNRRAAPSERAVERWPPRLHERRRVRDEGLADDRREPEEACVRVVVSHPDGLPARTPPDQARRSRRRRDDTLHVGAVGHVARAGPAADPDCRPGRSSEPMHCGRWEPPESGPPALEERPAGWWVGRCDARIREPVPSLPHKGVPVGVYGSALRHSGREHPSFPCLPRFPRLTRTGENRGYARICATFTVYALCFCGFLLSGQSCPPYHLLAVAVAAVLLPFGCSVQPTIGRRSTPSPGSVDRTPRHPIRRRRDARARAGSAHALTITTTPPANYAVSFTLLGDALDATLDQNDGGRGRQGSRERRAPRAERVDDLPGPRVNQGRSIRRGRGRRQRQGVRHPPRAPRLRGKRPVTGWVASAVATTCAELAATLPGEADGALIEEAGPEEAPGR